MQTPVSTRQSEPLSKDWLTLTDNCELGSASWLESGPRNFQSWPALRPVEINSASWETKPASR